MKADKELLEQLSNAGKELVRAVVHLKPASADAVPSAEEVTDLAQRLLTRVSEKVGHAAHRTNVLKNLNSVIIEADADFLHEIIKQPEIAAALPSSTRESLAIPPVEKRPHH